MDTAELVKLGAAVGVPLGGTVAVGVWFALGRTVGSLNGSVTKLKALLEVEVKQREQLKADLEGDRRELKKDMTTALEKCAAMHTREHETIFSRLNRHGESIAALKAQEVKAKRGAS